ncbi:MAG: DUF11 domain-containing protein, partial [Planctomycetota bacterium]
MLQSPAVGGTGTFSWGALTLPANEIDTFNFVVRIDSNAPNGNITNTARVRSNSVPSPGQPATFVVAITNQADVAVAFTTNPSPVPAGANISYMVTVTNNGPSDANNVTLTDAVPANTTFVSGTQTSGPAFTNTFPPAGGTGTAMSTIADLPAGASATFVLVDLVSPSAPPGSTITNTATVATNPNNDPNLANNSQTTSTQVVQQADLSVVKTASAATVTAGTDLTYTLTANNAGPSDAANFQLSDVLPANTTFVSESHPAGFTAVTPAVGGTGTVTESAPSFAAAANGTFTLVVHVLSSAPDGSTIANTASVTSDATDLNPNNNSSTATVTVAAVADLAVLKAGPATATAGTDVTYTIELDNNGPSDAQNVVLTDATPAGTTFVSATAPAGFTTTTPPVGGTGTISFNDPTVPAGAA